MVMLLSFKNSDFDSKENSPTSKIDEVAGMQLSI